MIHCSFFSKEQSDNYTLVSGSEVDVMIEFADLLLTYLLVKPTPRSEELMDLLTTIQKDSDRDVDNLLIKGKAIENIATQLFPIITTMLELGIIDGYIESKQNAMGQSVAINTKFKEMLEQLSNSAES